MLSLNFEPFKSCVTAKKEPAITAFCVADGVDACRVSLLKRYLLKYKAEYVERLAEVKDICCDRNDSHGDRKNHKQTHG